MPLVIFLNKSTPMPYDILISLILQDLRHNQLLLELEGRGLDLELHYLDLMTPIGRLMGLPADGIPDEFADVYTAFMNQAGRYPVSGRGEGLMGLAENCLASLRAICANHRKFEEESQDLGRVGA